MKLFESEQEYKDMEAALKTFPLIDFSVESKVLGENDVAVGDILTIKIQIISKNLEDNQKSGFIHSNNYPFLKKSHWYMIITDKDENEFFNIEKIHLREKTYVKEIKEMMR